jgi:hypothetical protein
MPNRTRSLKAIADLARAGVGRHGSSQTAVQFRVHHIADQPGSYRKVLEKDRGHQYIETLTSAANGSALIIETYDKRDAVDARPRLGGDPRAEIISDDEPGWKVFSGVAQPNPSFLFEGTTVLEGLIAVAPDVTSGELRRHHGTTVYRVMRKIARLAANRAGSPILSLQVPALVPNKRPDDRSAPEETWTASSSLAVRFSIAIGDVVAEDRVGYIRELAAFCHQNGLGLWVSDIRPNHRAGNWFEILAHDEERATETSRAVTLDDADLPLCHVLPLTLVGPARVGSTLVTLESFRARMPAILASSITVLDDLAFIHLQIGLTEQDHERGQRAMPEPHEPCPRPTPFLRDLEAQLQNYGEEISSDHLVQELAGYAPLLGPAMPIAPTSPLCRPIWLSWEVDSNIGGLREMILALSQALDDLVGSAVELKRIDPSCLDDRVNTHYPNIEYLISRDLGVGSVRAKGKLQIPDPLLHELPLFDDDRQVDDVDLGVAVATTLEDSWLMELKRKGVEPRELRVAWREWWLGR